MTDGGERVQPSGGLRFGLPHRHEQPVLAVDGGGAKGLADHGDDAGAVLAGRLGQELLEPQPERREVIGNHERQLVAARPDRGRHGRGQPGCRVGRRRRPQRLGDARGRRQQPVDVGTGEDRRHQPEQRQGRVAPADVRGILEHGREPALAGQRCELASGIGDHREAGRIGVSVPGPGQVAAGLECGPGLRRRDVQRALGCELDAEAGYGGGIGGVEHVQRRACPPAMVWNGRRLRGTGWTRPCRQAARGRRRRRYRRRWPGSGRARSTMSGTTVSHPSRSLISVGSARQSV